MHPRAAEEEGDGLHCFNQLMLILLTCLFTQVGIEMANV
jgi:hypothetical protein